MVSRVIAPEQVMRVALSLYNNAIFSHSNVPISPAEERIIVATGASGLLKKDSLIEYRLGEVLIAEATVYGVHRKTKGVEDICKYEATFTPNQQFYRAADEALTPTPILIDTWTIENLHSPHVEFGSRPPRFEELSEAERDLFEQERRMTHRYCR